MRLASTLIVFLLLTGNAIAAEMHKHLMTPEMKKQHETMHNIARYWSEAKMWLNEGNLDNTRKATDSMLEAADNVPEFRLHRNADKHEEFQRECNLFKNSLGKLREAILSRDMEKVRKFSESVDEACTRCHNKFR